jgi:hypothetical protein
VSELISLLYRAPAAAVSGEVTETIDHDARREMPVNPFAPKRGEPSGTQTRRYPIHEGGARLLRPQWLLTEYSLTEGDRISVDGREAVTVTAELRPGLAFAAAHPAFPRIPQPRPDRVTAVVDVELGVLLRCAEFWHGKLVSTRELSFTDPDVEPPEDDEPAEDDDRHESRRPSSPAGDAARQLAKGAARFAADAATSRVAGKLRRTDAPDDDARMPPLPEDRPSADGAPASDSLLSLLYASGDREFSATTDRWTNLQAVTSLLRKAADKTDVDGLGSLADAVDERGAVHMVTGLRFATPSRYRVDYVSGYNKNGLETVVCDDSSRWRFFPDKVVIWPTGALEDELAELTSGAWLLGCLLSGESATEFGGRPAIRFLARPNEDYRVNPLMLCEAADVIIDAELGIPLRIIRYGPETIAERWDELRDVTGSAGDVSPDVPPGVRVVHESGGLLDLARVPEPVKTTLRGAGSAARLTAEGVATARRLFGRR